MPTTAKSGFVRRNGWERPVNFQQIFAWTLMVVLGFLYFGIVAPQHVVRWRAAAYFVPGVFYAVHALMLFVCTSLDPADPNVAYDKSMPKELDRSKRKRVIENSHCFFCQVRVGPRSKHCSLCNKCVSDFDHHCRWMNSCVGGRTYKCVCL